jgi:hypothetical protein
MFVEQTNFIALMSDINVQCKLNNDALGTAKALAGVARSLNTLSLYESRRRRAAKALEEELLALQKEANERLGADLAKAAPLYKIYKSKGQTFDPAEFGFVCSIDELNDYLRGQQAAADVHKQRSGISRDDIPADFPATYDQLTAENRELEAEGERIMAEIRANRES